MWQNYLVAAFVGWCGTGWPIRWPIVGGGGGGVEPGDWPPNCPMCGGIVAAISAVILVAVLGPVAESAGLGGLIATSFFAGSFGSSLVGGAMRMSRG